MKRLILIVALLLTLVSRATAAISLIAIGVTAGNTGTTPVTVTCSATGLLPIKAHDLILAQISVYDAAGTAVTFTVTPPAGAWIAWPGYPNTNFVSGSRTDVDFLYYLYPAPPWGVAFTVADGGAHATNWNCRLWQFRGISQGTPNDGNASLATAKNAVTTVTTVSVTASTGDSLLVICGDSDHTVSSITGSPTLTTGYSDNAFMSARTGYLVPVSAGATTAYVCNSVSSTTMEGEQVLIAPPATLSTSVLYNSCASTGCAGVPPVNGWAYDPLAQALKLNSDNIWATMP